MSDWVRAFFAWYAGHELPGLFLFLLVEEAGVPLLIPGDTLIIVAGSRDRSLAGALVVIAVAALAAALGSSILYALMRHGGRPLLDRYGPYVHLDPRRVVQLERQFRRHGAIAIAVGRLGPGFRTPTTVMAGIFGVPYRTFVPSTTVAAVFYLGAALERAGVGSPRSSSRTSGWSSGSSSASRCSACWVGSRTSASSRWAGHPGERDGRAGTGRECAAATGEDRLRGARPAPGAVRERRSADRAPAGPDRSPTGRAVHARPARRGPGDRATLTDLGGDGRRTGRAAGPADGTPAHRSWGRDAA